ncbi:DNA cytosine methyltransferase [Geomonas nitrogeniifigens]|uniref:DNA cytosine methyltransferase n=1 Tax=Geomonas diazotrophica TaxID=2843197 RepID=UPI001C2BB6D3|nr:DNA cytosine methyltransferase [Geomonas nitrogeniifigens]QXE87409.1 DNA cytosine methyltransferase [Geomonas nitrogeniifigens]
MPTEKVIRNKIARLKSGNPPRFMDLFAGCGGISLGFATAGFELVASVELDPWAAESHGANFSRISHGKNQHAHFKARDITIEDPGTIFRDLEIEGPVDEQVDVLVGGPPCQAFARVGRAKLRHEALRREEDDADIAFLVDGRVNLWQRYLHYVRQTKPIALLMENVPDILNHGGKNVAEIVAEHLREEGYRVRYTLLNASWFGVPQTRERMFLIGVHEDLDSDVVFPAPTHFTVLPAGYEGTRATARKLIPKHQGDSLLAKHGYCWIHDPSTADCLPPTTTASEALADLPPIYALDLLETGRITRGRKDPSECVAYTSNNPTTAWSRLMRQWPGFATTDHTTGHVIRYLPRDYKIFRLMEEGWQYPEVWQFIEEKRQQLVNKQWRSGEDKTSDIEQQAFTREWTLPYDPKKFPNKWWKLYRDKPVRTLMAHLGKDSYSHIHFDSEQARTISVREAARLQSFPDGFILRGSMNAAFKQIGNAVPPLVSYAIAMEIRSMIGCQLIPDMRYQLLRLHSDATLPRVKE